MVEIIGTTLFVVVALPKFEWANLVKKPRFCIYYNILQNLSFKFQVKPRRVVLVYIFDFLKRYHYRMALYENIPLLLPLLHYIHWHFSLFHYPPFHCSVAEQKHIVWLWYQEQKNRREIKKEQIEIGLLKF